MNNYPTIIKDKTFDEERALYDIHNTSLININFDGPADGESALKECSDVSGENIFFNLRYPLWHDSRIKLNNITMTEMCRAAIWYTDHIDITNSKLHGIKALRECDDIKIDNCDIISPEFGWFARNLEMLNTKANSEYFMLNGKNLHLDNVNFTGKYSFQYVNHAVIENSVLNTKDAFWHSSHVTVRNCEVNGEYLGWYADHLTFIDCVIRGTQPLCYCKNLKLINCRMENTDLAFERSDVEAELTAHIDSIKNPYHGFIKAPSAGEIILDEEKAMQGICKLEIG